MININAIVSITVLSEDIAIEDNIDREMLERAKEGRVNYSIIIAKEAKAIYERYKKVTDKYKEQYDVSYGLNHNQDYLITISWQNKVKERMDNKCIKN